VVALYFRSRWCVSWLTFVDRESVSNTELIVAAAYFDSENFPALTKWRK
jgi:hypothetical protein